MPIDILLGVTQDGALGDDSLYFTLFDSVDLLLALGQLQEVVSLRVLFRRTKLLTRFNGHLNYLTFLLFHLDIVNTATVLRFGQFLPQILQITRQLYRLHQLVTHILHIVVNPQLLALSLQHG